METYFLFMDESYSSHIKTVSLTGILVNAANYPLLRSDFYDLLRNLLYATSEIMPANPPELHFSELLSNYSEATDDLRLNICEGIVNFVNRNSINIFRSSIYKPKGKLSVFKGRDDATALSVLNWIYLLRMVQDILTDASIIPVMDGFNNRMVEGFSQMVRGMDIMRENRVEAMFIKNSQNILGEVFYGDSKFSVFLQVADGISYLRNVSDFVQRMKSITDFKKRLLLISNNIDAKLLHEETQRFEE